MTNPTDAFPLRFGEPLTKWWRWFAWYPVDTADRGWVWLRWTYRRRIIKHDYLPIGGDLWFQHAIDPSGGVHD